MAFLRVLLLLLLVAGARFHLQPAMESGVVAKWLDTIASIVAPTSPGPPVGPDRVVDTVSYGAEPLRIALSNPPACCGGSEPREEVSGVAIYLKSSPDQGADFKILLGFDDQAVVKTSSDDRGLFDQELFRSNSLTRTAEGDLVMEIPDGILPSVPLRMWTAHAVPTQVQGISLSNRQAGEDRPVLVIKRTDTIGESSSAASDSQPS